MTDDDPPIGCAFLTGLLVLAVWLFVWLMVALWAALDPLSR